MGQVQQRVLASLLLVIAAPLAAPLGARKFYQDDPLQRDPKPIPVAKAQHRGINEYYDFFQNTFFEPSKEEKDSYPPTPSEAVNTLGEVPDSAWFINRMGSRPMSLAELRRGPGESNAPATDGPWTVVSGKNEGVTPGLVIRDAKGRKYFLKFDPKSNPEMASAADAIGSRFFYALGYNTPENYIVTFDRSRLTVEDKSLYSDPTGHKRRMVQADVDDVLKKVPLDGEGRYRGLASLAIPGDAIGPFRYHGVRKDDPNDVVEHQNRRDLRGLYVFAAWLNHTDTKSINSLDSIVEEDGVKFIRHYLIDFGAILGSDSFEAKSPRAGHVYLFDFKPAAWQFLSLGFYAPSWMLARYPHIPEVGHLGYETFDPERWRNNYPNPAFDLRNPGDTFWAAKKVMAFTDTEIRALVETGKYTDPRATDWTVKCLIERRNRIGRAFFDDVLPLDSFQVRGGQLVYEDLAAKYGFREQRQYSITWSEFDNESGSKRPVAGGSNFNVPRSASAYVAADIHGGDPTKTVTVYLRDNRVVGVDRTW